ncbi:hypothetical protein SAMN05216389_104179 [Oceanobacillus limi]|uniref:Uncharacterized protein n=1 Tax=Oceanobacillus limi TaxID=930131 RepID=A0A1I0B4H9_9BACI|nr:hypothetical protein [Oceanobacillus limi]SET01683.1 hypothetical protein SAMN05216389_104179 [Oceanobacillus limi]
MNRTLLRETLKGLKQDEFQNIKSVDIRQLTSAMLEHLGDPDGELRDSLIYRTFSYLIANGY